MDWKHFRQEGFLTLAIVLAGGVLLGFFLPNMSLRQAVLTIAVIALLLGWLPPKGG
jgi:hypothetical protein